MPMIGAVPAKRQPQSTPDPWFTAALCLLFADDGRGPTHARGQTKKGDMMADKHDLRKPKPAVSAPRITIYGPITEAYEGNPTELVKKLNVLRAGELAAELQYRHHAYMAISLAMPGVKAEFLEHAEQEAHHADLLAERIQQLDGDPVFDPADIGRLAEKLKVEIGDPQTLEDMIAFNHQVERRQIVAYTKLIREVAFHDPTTRRILEEILMDTEHHAAELADLLKRRAY